MGLRDLTQSRRTSFERCDFWNQKLLAGPDGKIDYSKMAHESKPTGFFYAEEVNSAVENPQAIGDLRYTGRTVSISTTDDVMGKLFRDDLVRYMGRIWRVNSITLQRDWKRSQFSKSPTSGTKVITLRS